MIEKIGYFELKDKKLTKEVQNLLINKGFLLEKVSDNTFVKSFNIFKERQ